MEIAQHFCSKKKKKTWIKDPYCRLNKDREALHPESGDFSHSVILKD